MKIEKYILKSKGLEVWISALGATITRMVTKDKDNNPVDVVLGFDTPEEYCSEEYLADYPYLGSTIGRYGNRIGGARFTIDGETYALTANEGENQLHGGRYGFDRKMWTLRTRTENSVVLVYVSADGEEGYPGKLTVEVTFTVEGKELRIGHRAFTDKPTHVSITHHPYFNLNPAAPDIKGHTLKMYSNRYLQTDRSIPTGVTVDAAGDFNFETPARLEGVIDNQDGLDHCYVFEPGKGVVKMAEVACGENGLKLTVSSDYPGVQVYTGKYLQVKEAKGGKNYGAFAGVALEAQFWPDSPNHADFPSTLLVPGQEYRKTIVYSFE